MTALTLEDIKKTAHDKMGKSLEALKSELHKIRTGRAHPGLLDQVHVDYYGSSVPISQVANVTLLDARTISVQPWEKGMGVQDRKGHPRIGPGTESRRRRETCCACPCRHSPKSAARN